MRKHAKVPVQTLPTIPHAMRGEVIQRVAELERNRVMMIEYCRMKLAAEDWHGVQDAASDLRDIDNELDGLRY